MKINDEPLFESKTFRELKQGDVFTTLDDEATYYLKVMLVLDANDIKLGAVNLNSGHVVEFEDENFVLPVDGEFVVKKVNT